MNNQEVAHIWASQSKQSARGSNFFFEGPSIFSYGHHFEVARIVKPGVVLLNAARYSVTTGQHQAKARQAVSHMKAFEVPTLRWQGTVDHNAGAEFYIKDLTDTLYSLTRRPKHSDMALEWYRDDATRAAEYVETFKKDIRKPLYKKVMDIYAKRENPLTPALLAKFKERTAAAREANKVERERMAALIETRRQERLVRQAAWLRGENDNTFMDLPVLLRLKDNEVQTSRGANVPLIEARKLYRALTAGVTLDGMRVGHYTVTAIRDGALVVGCHVIPLAEIDRIAMALGWAKAVA